MNQLGQNKIEQKITILMVSENQELLSSIFDILGPIYELKVAENTSSAKELLRDIMPRIIILDNPLSNSEMFWFSNWLKEHVLTDHIPILAFLKNDSEQLRIAAASAKIDAFLGGKRPNLSLFQMLFNNLLDATEKQRLWYSKNYLSETRQLSTGRKDEAFLVSLDRIVNANIDNSDLDVKFVCREMGISRTNLYTKVKAVTGMGLTVFIRENRLNLAAKLLAEQEMQTNEVMTMVGIQSHSYFSKAFKKKFGISPSSFGDT